MFDTLQLTARLFIIKLDLSIKHEGSEAVGIEGWLQS
jgi:hypothetical protein